MHTTYGLQRNNRNTLLIIWRISFRGSWEVAFFIIIVFPEGREGPLYFLGLSVGYSVQSACNVGSSGWCGTEHQVRVDQGGLGSSSYRYFFRAICDHRVTPYKDLSGKHIWLCTLYLLYTHIIWTICIKKWFVMGASSSNSRFHDEMITTTIMSSHHLNQICAQCGIFVHTQTRAQFFLFAGVHLSLAPGCYTLSATIAEIWYSVFFDVWYVNIYIFTYVYWLYCVYCPKEQSRQDYEASTKFNNLNFRIWMMHGFNL